VPDRDIAEKTDGTVAKPRPLKNSITSTVVRRLAAILICLSLYQYLVFEDWLHGFTYIEHMGLDLLFESRGNVEAPKDIVIVLVDTDSFNRVGVPAIYPWPRSLYAKALYTLKDAGAEAVLFDMAFRYQSLDKNEDLQLAEALGLLPTFIAGDALHGLGIREDLTPIEQFRSRVAGIGGIGAIADSSNKIRYFPVAFGEGAISQVASAAKKLRNVPVITQEDPDYFRKYINYFRSSNSYTTSFSTLSIADVLERKFPPEFFRGKIVFIGPGLIFEAATGETQGKDVWVAPDNSRILGVVIEATALSNLIHSNYITRLPNYTEYLVLTIMFFLALYFLLAIPPNYATLFATLVTVVTGSVSYILFIHLIFFPVVILNIFVWLTAIAKSYQLYIWEQKRRELLAQTFGRYLDPTIVQEIVTSGETPDLGGRTTECAMMFTDIVGFTTYAEKLSPAEVGGSLNHYFNRVQKEILSRQGTFLSLLGDGMFALWGAPRTVLQECEQALIAAVSIHQGEQKSSTFRTRIGLHYGEVLVGHFGSDTRFDYSAIGDNVNLTSRIEGMNKVFGTQLMMSDAFVSRLSNTESLMYLGKVLGSGVSRPVAVYTIDSYGIKLLYEAAVRHFENGELELALNIFDSINVSHPFTQALTSPYKEAIENSSGERYLIAHFK